MKVIPTPVQKGKDLKKYLCHRSVMVNMIENLDKITDKKTFYQQVMYILKPLERWYSYTGHDLYLYLIYRMSYTIKGVCVSEDAGIIITGYKDPENNSMWYPKSSINDLLVNCKKDNTILIPVRLITGDSGHANQLVIKGKQAWRIEPNAGTTYDRFDPIINKHLTTFCNEYKLSFKGHFPGECPGFFRSLFVKGPTVHIPHSGLCMFISVAKFIYGNKLTEKVLYNFIVNFFRMEVKSICSSDTFFYT
jgi:hypothetical protein